MTMTPEEIGRDFMQAKDRSAQIDILAELNACKTGDIIEILRSCENVDKRLLPRSSAERKPKTSEAPTPSPSQAVFVDAREEYIHRLEHYICTTVLGIRGN